MSTTLRATKPLPPPPPPPPPPPAQLPPAPAPPAPAPYKPMGPGPVPRLLVQFANMTGLTPTYYFGEWVVERVVIFSLYMRISRTTWYVSNNELKSSTSSSPIPRVPEVR